MSVVKDKLFRYLAKLATKGPAEERLASELSKKMRFETLAGFSNRLGSDMAQKTLNSEAMPIISKYAHPDVGIRQWNAAIDKVSSRLDKRDLDQYGKWSAMHQPSEAQLDKWIMLNKGRRAKQGRELQSMEDYVIPEGDVSERKYWQAVKNGLDRTDTVKARAGRADKAIAGSEQLATWLRKRRDL